jgi:Secretion system C-terminal sorting domain
MKSLINLLILSLLGNLQSIAQTFPWQQPLNIAWSTDGITFNTPSVFQDSAGVPSVIRWKGDTLIATFQWFRQPNPSPTWDRVAVKFSYDNGLNWTTPTPITISGMPSGYQRPFDPTLIAMGNDSVRIYFSSSATMPAVLDSTIDTHSAVSTDGVNYTFELNPRVNVLNNRVIDPAVIYFKSSYHYSSPIGSPQQGSYHYVSPDGVNFTAVPNIPSDNFHNWTGNFMVKDTSELRFYGAGSAGIWYNHSSNAGVWNGYVNTNIQGGDPTVLRVDTNNYLMIFVGAPYPTAINENSNLDDSFYIYPNPTKDLVNIHFKETITSETILQLYDISGKRISTFPVHENDGITKSTTINLEQFESNVYLLNVNGKTSRIIKH